MDFIDKHAQPNQTWTDAFLRLVYAVLPFYKWTKTRAASKCWNDVRITGIPFSFSAPHSMFAPAELNKFHKWRERTATTDKWQILWRSCRSSIMLIIPLSVVYIIYSGRIEWPFKQCINDSNLDKMEKCSRHRSPLRAKNLARPFDWTFSRRRNQSDSDQQR